MILISRMEIVKVLKLNKLWIVQKNNFKFKLILTSMEYHKNILGTIGNTPLVAQYNNKKVSGLV